MSIDDHSNELVGLFFLIRNNNVLDMEKQSIHDKDEESSPGSQN